MHKLLSSLSLAAVLALAPALHAQDTTTEPTNDEPAAEAEGTTPLAEGLSMGEEDGPLPAEPYVKAEHGDWKLQCFPVDEGEEPCQLYQLLKDEVGTDVAEVAIFRLPSGGQAVAGATVTVPLETLLTAQLTIAVDGGKGKRYPFSFCSPVGCYARIGFTADDIAAFKRGAKATVTLVPAPAPDQTVDLEMSLLGFSAAFDASTVIEN
ncbi:invasion associated locus B family protein [Aquicoccus porphyridii]|uniref:Invasion associated locus B family protein n=1 Tax=Aquicoccus porphyridii TaxID=1852029 RepID=A0A5A9ZVB4_9RHOB|nr:invasion associated locus B family protein [Aquicoccus porphyridii]KAA0920896.1 invasion associated locus B family protein [Aquicoccus porphyridii]RAI56564.1 invasion associated locus B family protein [Rhodobacteraceae bacterium AsT-22]